MPDFAQTLPATTRLAFVIDDIEVNRTLATAYLDVLGWTVREFDNATAALRALGREMPELMLIDIRMPGLAGDEMARRVRARLGSRVRLIGYTAHCMPDEIERFTSVGFDHMLFKPVSLAEMRRAVTGQAEAAETPKSGDISH